MVSIVHIDIGSTIGSLQFGLNNSACSGEVDLNRGLVNTVSSSADDSQDNRCGVIQARNGTSVGGHIACIDIGGTIGPQDLDGSAGGNSDRSLLSTIVVLSLSELQVIGSAVNIGGIDGGIDLNALELDAGDGKEIIFVVKQKITLKIIANASGNKKYIIKDAVGTELKAGDLSKTADGDTTIEITLEAGTYSFTSNGGGVRFAGIEATKAE